MYLFIKHIHVGFAGLSISLFFLRGAALLAGGEWPRRAWVRRLTDGIDSLLLLAALTLVLLSGQYPFVTAWVTAKVIGVVVYIGLGLFAFRLARCWQTRLLAWLGALLVAAYIVSVAVTRSPWGFLGRLLA